MSARFLQRLRRPRTLVLLGLLLVLVVGLRVALPHVVREVAVSQADQALVGRIALADVDLSLLRGAVTLHGVEVCADELPEPAPGAGEAAAAPAANDGAQEAAPAGAPLATMGRLLVRIGWLPLLRKTVEVREVELDHFVVRLDRARDGALVLPRPVPGEEEPPAEEPEKDEGSGWCVRIASVRLHDGLVGFRDFAADPEPARARDRRRPRAEPRLDGGRRGEGPGRLALEARIGDGSFALGSELSLAGATRAASTIELRDLPIDNARVYLTELGWSDVHGLLDADLKHDFASDGAHTVSGTIALRDLAVTVPEHEGPALAWKRLDVKIDQVDLEGRSAEVASVVLDGLRLPVRPNAPEEPVPLLASLLGGRGETAPEGTEAADRAEAAADEAEAASRGANADPPAAEPASDAPADECTPEPASGQPAAAPEPASDAAWTWQVREVRLSDAAVDLLHGDATTPLGLRADLKALSSDPSARSEVALGPPSGAGEQAARVRGTAKLDDLDVGEGEPAGDAFRVAWKSLALDVREAVVPAALGGEADAPPPEPEPKDTSEAEPPQAAAPAAESSDAAPLELQIARLTVAHGRIGVEDRAVRPAYRKDIRPLDVRASGIRWPGPTVELDGLPLEPLNPYAAGTGYGVGGGTASLESKLSMKGDSYDASNRLVLSDLAVTGEQGEALFQQQFGIPLSLALALLTDLEGKISLDAPVSGDRSGTSVDVTSIVGQALTKAILGAVTSPLKLVMAVGTAGGKVEAATPQAILFRAGRAELDEKGDEPIERLAGLLERSPALRIELTGRAGGEDERWLREQALREELAEGPGFFGAIASFGEREEREAVLEVLEKRAPDEPADVPPEAREWFDGRLAEQDVPERRIFELAAARAELVRKTLVEEHGIDAARVTLAGPDASATGSQAPEVALALGAGPEATLRASAGSLP